MNFLIHSSPFIALPSANTSVPVKAISRLKRVDIMQNRDFGNYLKNEKLTIFKNLLGEEFLSQVLSL